MPVIHVPRIPRVVVALGVAIALLACVPAPATAARPASAAALTAAPAGPAEVRAAKERLLTAVEPCSTRVPHDDVEALSRCAIDLGVPDTGRRHDLLGLIKAFVYCLWLQWPYDEDSLYPSVGSCMGAQGY
jgi:hypothetical protein